MKYLTLAVLSALFSVSYSQCTMESYIGSTGQSLTTCSLIESRIDLSVKNRVWGSDNPIVFESVFTGKAKNAHQIIMDIEDNCSVSLNHELKGYNEKASYEIIIRGSVVEVTVTSITDPITGIPIVVIE